MMPRPSTNPLPPLIAWIDCPVAELERAVAFYETVLQRRAERLFSDQPCAVIQHQRGSASLCLYEQAGYLAAEHAPLIYLHVADRLQEASDLITTAGGTVLKPAHSIGPYGYRTLFRDSEGNRMALHASMLHAPCA